MLDHPIDDAYSRAQGEQQIEERRRIGPVAFPAFVEKHGHDQAVEDRDAAKILQRDHAHRGCPDVIQRRRSHHDLDGASQELDSERILGWLGHGFTAPSSYLARMASGIWIPAALQWSSAPLASGIVTPCRAFCGTMSFDPAWTLIMCALPSLL